MLNLVKLAVTGGLSCGKSTVCHFLKQLGAYTVSADQIVHELLSDSEELVNKVTKLLGDEIMNKGKLNRQAIAKQVFEHPHLLLELEQLLHPHVFERIAEERERAAGHPLFVVEIPLLFETGAERDYDKTLAVTSKRGEERSGLTADAFKQRASRQLPPEEKAKRADIIITNDGTLDELQTAVTKVFNNLTTA